MKYGILGSGQLAQMLTDAGKNLGLEVLVFTGDWNNPDELKDFLGQVDHLVFENEFLPLESFKALDITLDDPRFTPRLKTMMKVQDKLEQKRIFASLGLPTAPFLVEENWTLEKLKTCSQEFSHGFVLKWSRLGYDGKGVWISPSSETSFLNEAAFTTALEFCKRGEAYGVTVYMERRAEYIRELSIVGCLSTNGEWKSYPVVISEQFSGVCRQAYGPAVELGIPAKLCLEIEAASERLARDIELFGTHAMEIFQISDTEFWINEVAPRVHNTGHFTLEAGITSQFENHWRGILGMPLGNTEVDFLFLMRNILGDDLAKGTAKAKRLAKKFGIEKSYRLHWYGKTEVRPGRKMGHVNYWNLTPELLNEIRDNL